VTQSRSQRNGETEEVRQDLSEKVKNSEVHQPKVNAAETASTNEMLIRLKFRQVIAKNNKCMRLARV
jgi:hypothetical protein